MSHWNFIFKAISLPISRFLQQHSSYWLSLQFQAKTKFMATSVDVLSIDQGRQSYFHTCRLKDFRESKINWRDQLVFNVIATKAKLLSKPLKDHSVLPKKFFSCFPNNRHSDCKIPRIPEQTPVLQNLLPGKALQSHLNMDVSCRPSWAHTFTHKVGCKTFKIALVFEILPGCFLIQIDTKKELFCFKQYRGTHLKWIEEHSNTAHTKPYVFR